MFDIKHDGRHKARFVGGGHLTDVPTESSTPELSLYEGYAWLPSSLNSMVWNYGLLT